MKRIIKRLGSLLLAAVLVLGAMPITTTPASATPEGTAINSTYLSQNKSTGNKTGMPYYTGGNFYLSEDITFEEGDWTVRGDTVLDLNGHGIILKGSTYISVYDNKTLTIKDTGASKTRYITLNSSGCGTAVQDTPPSDGNYVEVEGGFITGTGYSSGALYAFHGKITLDGGTIVGNEDCGVSIGTDGTFVMNGGTITRNGTGVQIGSKAVFEMTNGIITGNTKSGVHIHDISYKEGIFKLSGGTITDNTSTNSWGGGGVWLEYGNFELSGDVTIKGNTLSGKDSNVYVSSDKCITITGTMTNTTPIGIRTPKAPTDDAPVVFTNTATDNTSLNDFTRFKSDNTAYYVNQNDDGQLVISTTPAGKAVSWGSFTGGSISVTKDGSALSSGDLVAKDTALSINVTPETGYKLQSLTVKKSDGSAVSVSGSSNPYSFTMPDDEVTISATMKKLGQLTWEDPSGATLKVTSGSATLASGAYVDENETVTITATPGGNYLLSGLSVRQGDTTINTTGVGNTHSFLMPDGNVSISASAVERGSLKAVSEKLSVPALNSGSPTATYTYTINTTLDGTAADVGRAVFGSGSSAATVSGNGKGVYTYTTSAESLSAAVGGKSVSLNADNNRKAELNFKSLAVEVVGYKPESIGLDGSGPALALESANDSTKTYVYRSAYAVNDGTDEYKILVDGEDSGKSVKYGGKATITYHTLNVKVKSESNTTIESAALKGTKAGNDISLPMESKGSNAFTLTKLEDSSTEYTIYVNGEKAEKTAKFDKDSEVEIVFNRYKYTVEVQKDDVAANLGIVPALGGANGTPMVSTAEAGKYELISTAGDEKEVYMAGEKALSSLAPGTAGTVKYYSLVYQKSESEGGSVPAESVWLKDTNATLAASNLSNGSKIFAGWKIGDTVYKAGDSVKISGKTYAAAAWCAHRLDAVEENGDRAAVLLSPTEFVYDGTEKTPVVTVYYGSTKLTEGTDYTVSFGEDRVNVGSVSVTISGTGDYEGSIDGGSYKITQRPVVVTGITATDRAYNGSNEVSLNTGGATPDGRVGSDDISLTGLPTTGTADSALPGTWGVHYDASGAGLSGAHAKNYMLLGISGTEVNINKAALNSSNVEISNIADLTYNGEEQKPEISVKDKSTNTIIDLSNFDVVYSDNKNAGTAKVTIKASEDSAYESGSVEKSFTIKPATLSVKAKAQRRAYNTANPETLTYTVEGLQGEDKEEEVLSGALATAAVQSSKVGEYEITQGALKSNDNYTIAFSGAKLTVFKAAQDAPAPGAGYTVANGSIVVSNSTNGKANNETSYQLYDGSAYYEAGASVSIEEGKSYSIRWAGGDNYTASPFMPVATEFIISAEASPSAAGTVEGLSEDGKYAPGAAVSLIATPTSGYKFQEWRDNSGEVVLGADNNPVGSKYSFTASANISLIAYFVPEDKTVAALPTVADKTYNGSEQSGVSSSGTGCTLSGETSATNVGSYSISAKLNDGCIWPDGTSEDKSFTWRIAKADVEKPKVKIDNTTFIEDTESGGNGGKEIEYSLDGENWSDATLPSADKAPGTYFFRYKESVNTNAGPILPLSIKGLVVTTLKPSGLDAAGTSAELHGALSDTSGVSDAGFEYKAASGATWTKVSASGVSESFSAKLSGLTPDTDYLYHALAVAGGKTYTGEDISFHTPKATAGDGKIKVNIKSEDSGDTRRVFVTIEQGNDVITTSSAVPLGGASGANFDFENLPYGYYNVVAHTVDGDYVETRMLSVEGSDAASADFIIPVGKLATVVEVKGSETPKIAVEGLYNLITADEKNEAAAGAKDVEVKLKVEREAEDLASGAADIQNIAGRVHLDTYLDMSLFKITTSLMEGSITGMTVKDIGAENSDVLEIAIPYEGASRKAPKMYRYHDGAAAELSILEEKPSGSYVDGTFYVDDTNGYIFLYASGFSTYAIGAPVSNSGSAANTSNVVAVIGDKGEDDGDGDGGDGDIAGGVIASPAETGVSDWLITDEHLVYMNGYEDGTILPNGNITRAETAMIFYRLLKEEYKVDRDPSSADASSGMQKSGSAFPSEARELYTGDEQESRAKELSDVAPDSWYAEAVGTLSRLGIIKGYEDDSFRPQNQITRAEFAAIATRFAAAASGTSTFPDVPEGFWAEGNIAAAADYGWIKGYEDGTFRPTENITRAEAATIVNHMTGRAADEAYVLEHPSKIAKFSDLQDPTKWYYLDMVEASTAHDFTISGGLEKWKL